MDQVKVLIVDDHTLFRRGLAEILGAEDTLEVVGEASDGYEAVERARSLDPDVVLMDLEMPRCDGVEATRRIHETMPETRVLILTVSDHHEDLVGALRAGARGYILKNEQPDLLVQAIHYVHQGGIIVSPSVSTKLSPGLKSEPARVANPPLSPLEEQVLRLLAQRASDEVIAYRLSTTQAAVKTHLSNIQHKLRFANRRQLVTYATGAEPARPARSHRSHRQESSGEVTSVEEARDTAGTPEGGTDSPAVSAESHADQLLGDVELLISSELEPRDVLRLYQWLKEAEKAVITAIVPSSTDTTVLRLTAREPIPIPRSLAGTTVVIEITEEPDSENADIKRYRVDLKHG